MPDPFIPNPLVLNRGTHRAGTSNECVESKRCKFCGVELRRREGCCYRCIQIKRAMHSKFISVEAFLKIIEEIKLEKVEDKLDGRGK